MNTKDEIVEEVRAAREVFAAQFDYDLKRIFNELQKQEEQNPMIRAQLKPLKPRRPVK